MDEILDFDFKNSNLVNLLRRMVAVGGYYAKMGKTKEEITSLVMHELTSFDSLVLLTFSGNPLVHTRYLCHGAFVAYLAYWERLAMMTGKSDQITPSKMLPYLKAKRTELEEKCYQDGRVKGNKGLSEDQANCHCTEFILTLPTQDHTTTIKLIRAWYRGFDSILTPAPVEKE